MKAPPAWGAWLLWCMYCRVLVHTWTVSKDVIYEQVRLLHTKCWSNLEVLLSKSRVSNTCSVPLVNTGNVTDWIWTYVCNLLIYKTWCKERKEVVHITYLVAGALGWLASPALPIAINYFWPSGSQVRIETTFRLYFHASLPGSQAARYQRLGPTPTPPFLRNFTCKYLLITLSCLAIMPHSHCGILLWAMLRSHAAGSHALLMVLSCERFIEGTGHGAIFGYPSQCQYVMFCDICHTCWWLTDWK